MTGRDIQTLSAPPLADVILRTRPNWTAVIFFAALAAMHYSIAIPAFYHGRWEGYLSMMFAVAFSGVAWACYKARTELAIQPSQRRIRIRNGFTRYHFERFIPFEDVHGVRLTLSKSDDPPSHIELLCDNEDLDCPPTHIPRQQALFLAMLIGVRLIKVSDGNEPNTPEADEEWTIRRGGS